MIKLKNVFLLISLYTLMNISALADNKVAYLDIDYLLSNTNAGKILFQKLKSNEKDKNDQFRAEELKLKDEENKIIASKNIITGDQLEISINKFQKKLKNYKKTKSEEINKLKKTRNNEIINLLNLINPIIEDYMSQNSISIIIDKKNIYIANKNFDITNNLIEIINKKIK